MNAFARRSYALAGPIFLLALAMTIPARAQQTGQLSGKTVDANGDALPGVTVTASSESLMGERVGITNAEGRFVFRVLPPGVYQLEAQLEGFARQERSEIEVNLDRTTEVVFEMALATVTEQVVVIAETPVVDPEQVSVSTNFTPEYLKKASVSSLNRGYQSVLTNAGGAAGGANPQVFGSTLGENAFFIDGIDSTDPVTSTFNINLNFDTIQEINFEKAGFEAEFGRATGGFVNVVTKSGGNDYSGTFDWRYRDSDFNTNGDHFDTDENDVRFSEPAATFGGPFVQDQLWFFTAADQVESDRTPTSSPTTRMFDGLNLMGKVTWQAGDRWNLVGRWLDEDTTIDNANASQFRTPQATRRQEQPASISSLQVYGFPRTNLQLTFAAASVESELNSTPQSGDFTTLGHTDTNGTASLNYTNIQLSERDRDELKGSAEWFLSGAGDHDLKIGVERADMFFRTENFTTGGARYLDSSGQPFVFWDEPNEGPTENDGELTTLYAQDTWRLGDRVTLKLGARFDSVSYDNNDGISVDDMEEVQPRVGLAWDLLGDNQTILRASFGRFLHPNATTLPAFAKVTSAPAFAYLSCSAFVTTSPAVCSALFGGQLTAGGITVPTWRLDPQGFDPAGYLLVPANVFGSSPNTIDPGLEPTVAEEIVIGVEHQLGRRTSIGLSYIDKDTEDIFEDTCVGNVGPGGPAAGAPCDSYVMANLPGLERTFEGLVLDFESRFTDWFHVLASYTWGRSQGSVEYTQNAGTDFDIFPDHFQNRFGYLSDDVRNRFKVSGFVDLPLDFTIGFDGFWSDKYAYEAREAGDIYGEVFLEPRGSRRANETYRLDLQAAKGFQLGGLRVEAIAAVLNVFDDEQVLAVCDRIEGCAGIELGAATSFRQPRFYEAGIRIEF